MDSSLTRFELKSKLKLRFLRDVKLPEELGIKTKKKKIKLGFSSRNGPKFKLSSFFVVAKLFIGVENNLTIVKKRSQVWV
jgi:hypothetical protein